MFWIDTNIKKSWGIFERVMISISQVEVTLSFTTSLNIHLGES